MVYQLLQRIDEFAPLPIFELRAMAERAHVLCIPKGRWLIQRGQELPAYLYLAKGRIQTFSPDRVLRANRQQRIRSFYPGCNQARALHTSYILRIDAAQRDFLLSRNTSSPQLHAAEESIWLQNFLRTHMMQQIPTSIWRSLIDAFSLRRISAGTTFIKVGEPGQECFVVESGHAVVHLGGKTLAHLGPGDFFGEDALISGARRSANVSALDDLRLHAVQRSAFNSVVLNRLIVFMETPGPGTVLNLDNHCHLGAQPFSLAFARDLSRQMDPRQIYYVIGGNRGERALCAFLLIRRGFQAHPLK